MARLAVIEGHWEAPRVEFLDADGNVTMVSQARARNTIGLEGLVMRHQGCLVEPEIQTEGWIRYDPTERKLKMSSVSSRGRHDEFTGHWEDGSLIMTIVPRKRDARLFRLINSEFSDDSFHERLEVSMDDGHTWRVSSRQIFHRIPDPVGMSGPACQNSENEDGRVSPLPDGRNSRGGESAWRTRRADDAVRRM